MNSLRYPNIASNQKSISLLAYPKVDFQFTAEQNNMGIITMDLQYGFARDVIHKNKKDKKQELSFRIKEVGASDWFATSTYNPTEIGISKNHPFGFPLISDSKGKKYLIELEILHPDYPQYVTINTKDTAFKTIYQLSKRDIITSPSEFIALLSNRMTNITTSSQAHMAFYYILPTLITFGLLFFTKNRYRYFIEKKAKKYS